MKATKRTKVSTCARKRRYATAIDAGDAARAAEITLRPYRCDRCGQHHLTSRTKGKRDPKRLGSHLAGSGDAQPQ